jgi:hypothetical protein
MDIWAFRRLSAKETDQAPSGLPLPPIAIGVSFARNGSKNKISAATPNAGKVHKNIRVYLGSVWERKAGSKSRDFEPQGNV